MGESDVERGKERSRPAMLVCLGLALAVTLAVAGPARAQEWKELDVQKCKLVTTLPELRRMPVRTAAYQAAGSTRAELLTMSDRIGGPPTAQLYFAQIQFHATSVFTDDSLPPVAESVAQMFPGAIVEGSGEARNAVGKGEYVRYRAANRHCVFFRVHDGMVPPDMFLLGGVSANILGKTRMVGWYCPSAGLSDEQADAFIESVGIEGYAEPQG